MGRKSLLRGYLILLLLAPFPALTPAPLPPSPSPKDWERGRGVAARPGGRDEGQPCAPLVWEIETVDGDPNTGWDTSLALDAAGRPHISYYDNANEHLKYAYYDGSAWQIQTPDSGGYTGSYSSLALDAAGRPISP